MSTPSTDRKPQVDYGVQIRFIKDLHDTGGGYVEKSKINGASPSSSKYGVAVRVQGISGQPYVVLKDGQKGDSYGVQLTNPTPSPTSGPPSPYNSVPKLKKEPSEFTRPFSPVVSTPHSPVSPPAEDEDGEIFGSPLKRPPGDGQAGTQAEEEGGAGRERAVERPKSEPTFKAPLSELEEKKDRTDEEEYNEAGLKSVKSSAVGPKRFKQTGSGFSNSLGRYNRKKLCSNSSPQPFPEIPPLIDSDPVQAIDTNSLAPINKLISKFNNGSAPQTRGRSGARQRLRFDERRRSRSLDARKDVEPEVTHPLPKSPILNPYAASVSASSSLLMSSAPGSSLGKSPVSATKVVAVNAPKASFKPPEKFVAKDGPPAIARKPSPSQSTEVINWEEAHVKQAIYNILKEGTMESEGSLQRKVNLVYETTDRPKKGESAGSVKKNLESLQKQLERCKKELDLANDELSAERIDKELAESRLHLQEDQLAQLQEELRRVSDNLPQSDSFQTDVVNLQAQLAETTTLLRRQDEVLHQRERELTALKGALKEEVECHDREMEALREQYGVDMESLRKSMEQFTQSQELIEEEREKVNASLLTLEEELESSRDQGEQWRAELETTARELQNAKLELKKSVLEKEKAEDSLKDARSSLLSLKKEKSASADNLSLKEELRRCHDDLKQARADLDKLKGEIDEKNEALEALRRASDEKEAELRLDISRLKEQFQKDKAELEKSSAGSAGRTEVDHATSLQEENPRLRERLTRMTRLQSSLPRSSNAEEELEALEDDNRFLKAQLEEAKRGATRLGKEKDELTRRLEERDLEREALRRGKGDLEEQKRLLDRALEKLNKEMEVMMGDSRQSVATLQTQLEDFRERSRKDLLEAQRNNKDRLAELQRAQNNLKAQQEEVGLKYRKVSSSSDLQLLLGRFAAECEAAGMRISTSKSETMVLDRKRVACQLRVGGEVLPQVEEFKYLGVLFTSEGRRDREIDRRIGSASAVMRTLSRSVVVKRELSQKARLSIYRSIYVPILTYGHELWVMTERTRSRIQAAEMSFLRRVAGLSLRDRVRSSDIREGLGVEPLLLRIERSQLRWFGHLVRMPPGRLPGEVFRACPAGRRPPGRPRTRWRSYISNLVRERLGVLPEELVDKAGERTAWSSLVGMLPPRPGPG